MNEFENDYIVGSGGGKGGQRAPVEAPNTLRSRSTIKVVEVLSEGEIKGLVGGLKGVFLDNTPVQNGNGTFNFPAVKFDERTGTPDQEYLPGFPGSESAVVINTEVTATPVVRSVSSSTVDAVRVTVRLPQGLSNLDAGSGDLNGHRVGIALDVRPANGTWVQVFTKVITGKSVSPYEESYRVEKPNTATGLWEVRVRRTTGVSTSVHITDRVDWFTMTEIQDVKLSYPDAAHVGIAIDAESTGGAVPRRSYLIDGLIIKVPTNYTPTVYDTEGNVVSYASYNGVWNGTFKDSWSDDPAWILYDMLTNERYGMGEFIDTADIDIYSFYEASKYNCELIKDGTPDENLEPRFRCNAPVASREDAYKVLQSIAAMSRCMLFSGPGYLKLIQDRPQAPTALLTNANVIDGQFSYMGTDLSSRVTAVDVTYNNHRDRYLPTTTTVEASPEDIAKYGFNKLELTALGVVHEGQAIRLGKWALDSALNTKEVVTFAVSWNNAFIEINDVVNIADNFYAAEQFGGVIKAGGTGVDQIVLDRPVTVTAGQTLKFMTFAGVEHTRTIASTGTFSTLTLQARAGAVNPSEFAGCAWAILGAVVPRQFKITSIKEDSPGVYEITASEHDSHKYSRIEEGIYVDPAPTTTITGWTVGAPQNLTATPETFINSQGVVRYRLRLNWDDVDDALLRSYRVQWRRNNGQYMWTQDIHQSEFVIEDAQQGVYEYFVYAYNTRGVQSPGTSGWYDLYITGTDPSPLNAPTNLRLVNGGNAFTGTNFTFIWNAGVVNTSATLMDYEIRFLTPDDVEKKIITQSERSFTVSRQDIINWFGSATRNIKVQVRARDTLERRSLPAVNTFSNAAPAVPTGIGLVPFTNYYKVDHDAHTGDVVGLRIHQSLTSGFTPSATNLIKDDVGASHLVEASPDTTYYLKVAAYDSWGTDELIYSGEYNVKTTAEDVGITPEPPSGLLVSSSLAVTDNGDQYARLNITWNKGLRASSYDLEIIEDGNAAYYPMVSQPDTGNTVSYQMDAQVATEYKIRVRSRASASISVWSDQVIHTSVNDTTAPPAPTGVIATSGYNAVSIKWTAAVANDVSRYQVMRVTSASASDTIYVNNVVATVPHPLVAHFDSGLTAGTTYYYKIRAIDKSGNISPLSASASVLVVGLPPNSVDGSAIADGAISVASFASGISPVTIVTGSVVPTTKLTDVIMLTGTGKLYRWVGGAYTASTPTSDLTGFIQAAQIEANSITAGQIAADTITAGQIAAGAISASEIAAGAVTASKLAVADYTNYIPDNNLQDVAAWSLGSSQWTFETVSDTAFRSKGRFVFTKVSTGYSAPIRSNHFGVEGGKQYHVSYQVAHSGIGTYASLGRVWWFKADGSAATPEYSDFTLNGTNTTIREASASFKAPDGAVEGRMGVYFQNTNTSGIVYLGGLSVRRMNGGELIVDGSIKANHLEANTITAGQIAANTITANEIFAHTITANEIAANTITANEINVNSITAAVLTAGSITAGMIAADAINATHIAANTIDAQMIGTNQIITNQANIATGVITSAHIANATIETADIKDGAITNLKIGNIIQSSDFVSNSAGWQINKNGTIQLNGSSGQGRTRLTSTQYLVYDASNNLRVRIGIW